MRLSREESARIERVARHVGLSAASLIRMLVKREDDAVAALEAERTRAARDV